MLTPGSLCGGCRARVGLLVEPWLAAGVVVLAVNDHLLKGAGPGWLTGKLSDVAGLFVVTVFAGVVLRPRLAVVAAAAGFAAVKLSPVAAQWAAPLLGGTTRQDPTDLLALVAVVPAYRLLRRHIPDDGGSFGRSLVMAASLAAVTLTVSATSCRDPAIDGFVVRDGEVWAHVDRPGGDDAGTWAVSADGGRTWSESAAPPASPSTDLQGCDAGGRCWRVVPSVLVEEQRPGAPWRRAFAFSDREMKAMETRTDSCGTRPELLFGAVVVVDRPDGPNVVVGMGSQGVLHRSPAGVWERRPVADLRPVRTSGSPRLTRWLTLSAVVVLVAVVPLAWWWGRRRPGRRGGEAALVAGLGAALVLMATGALVFIQLDFTVVGPLIVALAVAILAASLFVASRPARPKPILPPSWPPTGPGNWPPPAR